MTNAMNTHKRKRLKTLLYVNILHCSRKNGAVKKNTCYWITHIASTGKNSLWHKILVDSHSHGTIILRSNKIPSTEQNCNGDSPCAAHINTYSATHIWLAQKTTIIFQTDTELLNLWVVCQLKSLWLIIKYVDALGEGGGRVRRQPRAKKKFKGRGNIE